MKFIAVLAIVLVVSVGVSLANEEDRDDHSIGACIDGKCVFGYHCAEDQQCRLNVASSFGPCGENATCPDGFKCSEASNQCHRIETTQQ